MKQKTFSLVPAMFIAALLSLASCGGNNGKANGDSTIADSVQITKAKPVCQGSNAISVTIKGYKYGITGDLAVEMASFEVKQSSWNLINDSVAEMTLKNYTSAELVGDRKEDQIDINVQFRGRNGKKIEPGVFTTSSDPNRWVQATMLTSKGKVWFNWLAGMPEVGSVKLNCVNDDKVCGAFALASEKPENGQIGVVRLSGEFFVGE